jgi:tryptophanase
MKKILSIAVVSAFALILSTGCASKEMSAHIDETDESTIKSAIYIGDTSNEKAIHAIEEAAKNTGWRVTKFKSNAVIVEKIVDDKTISRTIKVYNKHISGDEAVSGEALEELRAAIVKELQKKEETAH